jgi:curved DNA-binding protein CbpA
MSKTDPYQILGIEPESTGEQIRAAYLRKIQQYPPERHPEEFECIRDAYSELSDPRERTRKLLFGGDPMPPFVHLLEGWRLQRRFVGPKPWLALLREK